MAILIEIIGQRGLYVAKAFVQKLQAFLFNLNHEQLRTGRQK